MDRASWARSGIQQMHRDPKWKPGIIDGRPHVRPTRRRLPRLSGESVRGKGRAAEGPRGEPLHLIEGASTMSLASPPPSLHRLLRSRPRKGRAAISVRETPQGLRSGRLPGGSWETTGDDRGKDQHRLNCRRRTLSVVPLGVPLPPVIPRGTAVRAYRCRKGSSEGRFDRGEGRAGVRTRKKGGKRLAHSAWR